ncbi:MAG: stage IV sporulation protein A [Clostridium sp.]|jgi:stage IV sporulation protein A|nr:stage IV sporulation protein A [Clostridium sp.]
MEKRGNTQAGAAGRDGFGIEQAAAEAFGEEPFVPEDTQEAYEYPEPEEYAAQEEQPEEEAPQEAEREYQEEYEVTPEPEREELAPEVSKQASFNETLEKISRGADTVLDIARKAGEAVREGYNIYKDIAKRTQGDVYVGVVGPVRTGKSTLVRRFMETLVIPNMREEYRAQRANDEMPQSSSGRTIMTTEPKFVPEKAVQIDLPEQAKLRVRLIDCVGYIVPSALGYIEGNQPRMVRTPWFDEEIPFNMAAEIGTQKVISEHSTIGILVTTDGSISSIPRAEYDEAEERVVCELKALDKPFVVLLNCREPRAEQAQALAGQLEEKYGVPVLAVNCMELTQDEIRYILGQVLFEFPIKEIALDLPRWVARLDRNHWLRSACFKAFADNARGLRRVRQVKEMAQKTCGEENISCAAVTSMDLARGAARISITMAPDLFYRVLAETTGLPIQNEQDLMDSMRSLAQVKSKYERVANALTEVEQTGYGIVLPALDELSLDEPEIMRQGGRYGVRLRASAPSIHLLRADITTEVAPIVGSESQSEELVHYLLKEFEENPAEIWQSNIFGKSLHELVNEGLHNKLYRMPADARIRIQETLEKIINDGAGGLICIIL